MIEELTYCIESLNLKKYIGVSEVEYFIDAEYAITIEFGSNVFFICKNELLHKNKYLFVSDVSKLKEIYLEKTGINIDIMLRKYKINKIKQIMI